MTDTLPCPACSASLDLLEQGLFRCDEDHHYTPAGLALSSNLIALRALWLAVHALEADSATLHFVAERAGLAEDLATRRRAEADEAASAARVLRGHAQRAQERLDSLPVAPSTLAGGDDRDPAA